MKVWLRDHRRSARDAVLRLAVTPMASLLNIIVIGVALSLPVGLYLAMSQVQGFTRELTRDPQVNIFLDLDASAADAQAVEKRLRNHRDVATYRFIARAEALAALKRNSGLADVLDELEGNPLPDAFVATGVDSRPETLERVRDAAAQWPKVAHVQLDAEWARRLHAALGLGRTAAVILGALLSAALVAVTFNTIRLQILTRREEIEISKLIGATNPFIRRPFLYFGTLQGLTGGLAAWGILAAAVFLLNRDLEALSAHYAADVGFSALRWSDSVSLLVFSGALGWIGAWLSVSQHLWRAQSP